MKAAKLLNARYFMSVFSFGQDISQGWQRGGITALLLVEAIRCDNTLNLLVVFCAFFVENTHRDRIFIQAF